MFEISTQINTNLLRFFACTNFETKILKIRKILNSTQITQIYTDFLHVLTLQHRFEKLEKCLKFPHRLTRIYTDFLHVLTLQHRFEKLEKCLKFPRRLTRIYTDSLHVLTLQHRFEKLEKS